MLLSSRTLEIKDIDGNVVSGVSGNYFNMFSAAFTTCGKVINLPSQAVGKKGFMVVKTTCIKGFNYISVANGAALNQTWWVMAAAKSHYTGEIAVYNYDIATLPSTMKYEEYNTNSKGWHTSSTRYNIEIKIYY